MSKQRFSHETAPASVLLHHLDNVHRLPPSEVDELERSGTFRAAHESEHVRGNANHDLDDVNPS